MRLLGVGSLVLRRVAAVVTNAVRIIEVAAGDCGGGCGIQTGNDISSLPCFSYKMTRSGLSCCASGASKVDTRICVDSWASTSHEHTMVSTLVLTCCPPEQAHFSAFEKRGGGRKD